jgi:hypothetical protein
MSGISYEQALEIYNFWVTGFMILELLSQVYLRAFGSRLLEGFEAIFPKKK